MLLRTTHISKETVSKINVIPQLNIQQTPNSIIPHRNALTAKVKSRQSQLSHNKTLSNKPFNSSHSHFNQPESENDFMHCDESHSLNNSQHLAQFDNLQLQDFLKMVILGNSDGVQTKSKEIIKSLNGTWFKSTHSQDLSSHKFYNNLGIKRTSTMLKSIKKKDEKGQQNSNELLKRQYTPPNIFPLRKISPRKNQFSKYIQTAMNNNLSQIIENKSPLKESILRKASQGKRMQKRATSSFSNKPAKNVDVFEEGGLLLGKKMVLHNQ